MTALATPSRTGRPPVPGGARLRPAALAGTAALVRLALRRDRVMLPAWVYVVAIMVVSNGYSFGKLYQTAAQRAELVASGESNPALLFLYGRLYGTSVGALTAWRIGVWAAMFAALMSVFLVIRHTRGDEEAGRLELIGSARVGRQAPLVAALAVAAAANVVLAALLCLILPAFGLPAAGSAALALATGGCGLAFTGVSAVAAQLTSGARAARGLAIGLIGLAFLARAVGDSAGVSGPAWLTWALPLGWTETVRPFAAERWWVLALPLALLLAGVWLSFALAARRDHGAGLLPDRPGRPAASGALRGPLALAWRLQWPALAGWAAGFAVLFAICGAAGKGIAQLVGTSGTLNQEFTRIGGQAAIVDAYLAGLMLLAGLFAAAYGTSAVLRLRAEEGDGRADPVLAAAVGRRRWGLSHLCVAIAGTAGLLAVAGVATGLGYGLAVGGSRAPGGAVGVAAGAGGAGAEGAGAEALRMLGAGMGVLPAALVLAGIAALAFGLLPGGCAAVGWSAVGLTVMISIFGQAIQLSHWIVDVSPFTHVPRLPGGTVSVASLTWLILIALLLFVIGLAGLRRRDIG